MWSNLWKDFIGKNDWRFPDTAPSQLRELLNEPITDDSERVRANWMWRRRPKLTLGEKVFAYSLVLAIGVSLPLIHEIGLIFYIGWLSVSFLLIASDKVRAVRWRRDYEASLCRLMRTKRKRKTI